MKSIDKQYFLVCLSAKSSALAYYSCEIVHEMMKHNFFFLSMSYLNNFLYILIAI